MSSISQTKVPLVNIFFGNMIRLNKFPSWLSQNWIFFESPNDRTTCPVIHGFARTMLDSDRTLSVDRPLFQALVWWASIPSKEQDRYSWPVHATETDRGKAPVWWANLRADLTHFISTSKDRVLFWPPLKRRSCYTIPVRVECENWTVCQRKLNSSPAKRETWKVKTVYAWCL